MECAKLTPLGPIIAWVYEKCWGLLSDAKRMNVTWPRFRTVHICVRRQLMLSFYLKLLRSHLHRPHRRSSISSTPDSHLLDKRKDYKCMNKINWVLMKALLTHQTAASLWKYTLSTYGRSRRQNNESPAVLGKSLCGTQTYWKLLDSEVIQKF